MNRRRRQLKGEKIFYFINLLNYLKRTLSERIKKSTYHWVRNQLRWILIQNRCLANHQPLRIHCHSEVLFLWCQEETKKHQLIILQCRQPVVKTVQNGMFMGKAKNVFLNFEVLGKIIYNMYASVL